MNGKRVSCETCGRTYRSFGRTTAHKNGCCGYVCYQRKARRDPESVGYHAIQREKLRRRMER